MNLVSIRLCGILSLNDCINVELMPPMHVDAGMIVVVVVVTRKARCAAKKLSVVSAPSDRI